MADKEVLKQQPCPVCKGPSLVQYDKGGKLFTMCDGRHPDHAGCGARIYFGPGNTARMKAEHARKGKGNDQSKPKAPANQNAGNDNAAGAGDGAAGGGKTGSWSPFD